MPNALNLPETKLVELYIKQRFGRRKLKLKLLRLMPRFLLKQAHSKNS